MQIERPCCSCWAAARRFYPTGNAYYNVEETAAQCRWSRIESNGSVGSALMTVETSISRSPAWCDVCLGPGLYQRIEGDLITCIVPVQVRIIIIISLQRDDAEPEAASGIEHRRQLLRFT